MHSRMQATVLAVIGIVFASPFPERVMTALSPQKSNANGEIFTYAADRSWMHFVEVAAPWTRVAGLAVVFFFALWLLAKAGNAYITPRWPRAISYTIAGCLGVVAVTMTVIDPPQLAGPAGEIGTTLKRAQSGVSGKSDWKNAPSSDVVTPTPQPTTTAGQTSWTNNDK